MSQARLSRAVEKCGAGMGPAPKVKNRKPGDRLSTGTALAGACNTEAVRAGAHGAPRPVVFSGRR